MERNQHLQILYAKFLTGSISRAELDEMLDYFKVHGIPEGLNRTLLDEISKPYFLEKLPEEISQITDRVEQKLREATVDSWQQTPRPFYRRLPWVRYAAAVIIVVLAGGAWLFLNRNMPSKSDLELIADEREHIAPAGNRATIKLSDGRTIDLDDQHDGIVIDAQQISYNDGSSHILKLPGTDQAEFITLTTPRGGTYHVTLPDGTKVWLNAQTTLKYPSHFSASERIVHLEGEAYFDVQPHSRTQKSKVPFSKVPFKVYSAGQVVEVLGTVFNISAYADEKEIKTTLVEGKVSIQTDRQGNDMILMPGEQSRIGVANAQKVKVDVRDYIDWKNGEFVFREETASEVLMRIARWYDIDVDYRDDAANSERFSGAISRYDQLKTILDIMEEASDLEFGVHNRTVVVHTKKN